MKPFVFVLMPFNEDFDDIYKLGIKDACKETDCYSERVDEQIFHERILDRIYNQINKADIIIADVSGRNANVFYEVGYAHALQKKVILITKTEEDIPFDFKHFPHVIYENKIVYLKDELKRRLSFFLANPEALSLPNSEQLEFYLSGQKIEDGKTVEAKIDYYRSLQFDITNVGSSIIHTEFKIGIIADSIFTSKEELSVVHLPNNKMLHIFSESLNGLFPQAWRSFTLNLPTDDKFLGNAEYKFTLRVFNELGIKDIDFNVSVLSRLFGGW